MDLEMVSKNIMNCWSVLEQIKTDCSANIHTFGHVVQTGDELKKKKDSACNSEGNTIR